MIKARLKKLRFATLGFLVLLLALSPVSSVFAVGFGHGFYGTVKVDDVDAGVGTVISARVGGTQYGSCTVTTLGQYALIVQNDIDESATIHFYVDGQEADQTFPFHDGWTTELDLTAPAPPVVQYTLTMAKVGNGAVTPVSGTYPEGDMEITATADPGWKFAGWSTTDMDEILDASSATTTLTLDKDKTVTANFEEVPPGAPTVTTQAATNITTNSATLNMNYTVGDFSPVDVRFAYKKSADSAWSYTAWVSKAADGTHAEPLTGLNTSTDYDFKAQLKYDTTEIEGDELQFTTAAPSGCFIATAAYGTPTAEQIDVLREFRDVVLLESAVGSQFVALYYQLSPPVANFISGSSFLRTLVREFLVDPIVWIVEAAGTIWRN